METLTLPGLIGIIGGIVAGGVATFFSIRRTLGPRERRFAIYSALTVWSAFILTGIAAYLMPGWRSWAWAPVVFMAVLGAPYVNRRQAAIRSEENPDN